MTTDRSTAERWRGLIQGAAAEARRRWDTRIGTEHLLLSVLRDAETDGAATLGIDLETARQALEDLDRTALAAVGLQSLPRTPPREEPSTARPLVPLTSGARRVLRRAGQLARPARGRHIQAGDVLLALLSRRPPDPVAVLFAALEVDGSSVRAALETRYEHGGS